MFINQNKYTKHSYFMSLAAQQAHKMLGKTGKNPAVGCVIVKNNHTISAGHTSINGRPHAEYNAIHSSKTKLNNSELYVTLEPCSHYGKTFPCVKAIIKNKIRRVFFSIKDPDLRSFNKSTKEFKKFGIRVKNGILNSQTRYFYKSYIKSKKNTLPFVTAKMAISKDFYTNNKRKKWITNSYSRRRVQLMRSNHDCILTGINTVIIDNPMLTCRIFGMEKFSPARIILDKNLRVPIKSYIVQSAQKYRTFIFYNKINQKKIKALKKHKVNLIKTELGEDQNLDLKKTLMRIKLLGYSRIFLESGLNLTTNFLKKGLVDVFHLFISSKNLGVDGNNSFKNNVRIFLKKKKSINEKVYLFDDKLTSYSIK